MAHALVSLVGGVIRGATGSERRDQVVYATTHPYPAYGGPGPGPYGPGGPSYGGQPAHGAGCRCPECAYAVPVFASRRDMRRARHAERHAWRAQRRDGGPLVYVDPYGAPTGQVYAPPRGLSSSAREAGYALGSMVAGRSYGKNGDGGSSPAPGGASSSSGAHHGGVAAAAGPSSGPQHQHQHQRQQGQGHSGYQPRRASFDDGSDGEDMPPAYDAPYGPPLRRRTSVEVLTSAERKPAEKKRREPF